MPRKSNPYAKTRDVENPYAEFRAGGLTWRVLKTYQHPDNEKTNPYARWFVAGKSAATYGQWEYGDMYAAEIKRLAICTRAFPPAAE